MSWYVKPDDSCAACGYEPGACVCPTLDVFHEADEAWKDRLAA